MSRFAGKVAPATVVAEVILQARRLDILVNNAGLMRDGSVLEMDEADWAAAMQVNLTAPFLLSKTAPPHLIDTKGAIVNIGSIEALGSTPRNPAYCASKAGLHDLTRAAAVDHGPDGLRCNAVAPGWIDTGLIIDFVEDLGDPAAPDEQVGGIPPAGRTGKPQEIGVLTAWLCSAEAGFVAGRIWAVDGGRMAQLSLP